ncbi:unnamed protein product [Camellia sinensis]
MAKIIGWSQEDPIKPPKNVGSSVKGRKWRLWRSDKGGHVAASDLSSFGVDDVFSAVVATVARGTTKEFMVLKQEWAAIRIQTMFRDSLFDWAGQGPRGSTPWRVQWQRSGWGRAVQVRCFLQGNGVDGVLRSKSLLIMSCSTQFV